MKRTGYFFLGVLLFALNGRSEEMERASLQLQPIYLAKDAGGPLQTAHQFGFARTNVGAVAFRAVLTNKWFPGLVPIFQVERRDRIELRRHPPRGQENITEPFFFALPPEAEVATAAIAGHWRCLATRADGSKAYPDFEIATDGTNVAARFDQNTEYRFAFITGGTFVEGELKLKVEYISERYELVGHYSKQRLTGQWNHSGGNEAGSWTAERDLPAIEIPSPERVAPLYELRGPNGAVRYALTPDSGGEDWIRSPAPLCRVWAPERSNEEVVPR